MPPNNSDNLVDFLPLAQRFGSIIRDVASATRGLRFVSRQQIIVSSNIPQPIVIYLLQKKEKPGIVKKILRIS